ncbi:prepilin-type N-terminal cleavage/methylation domain-containing protein [Bacillus tianshenii]|nr:prepilin-type N-terminal cleavage/methylation domain-containing protein [Bacillus tianshenii]
MLYTFFAKLKSFPLQQRGYTLVEVLLAITILSVIFVSFFYFFTNAYQYTKENQSKTVGIHAARNAVIYLENQSFADVKNHIGATISTADCASTTYSDLFTDAALCESILNPKINNVHYEVALTISEYENGDLDSSGNLPTVDETKLQSLLVHTSAKIKWKEDKNNRERTSVEGVVVHESLR